jgi:hypothetical protein
MAEPEKNVLLELEKILQTCLQMLLPPPETRSDSRNKILVSAVEVARGPASREQKRALEGMNVWKRVNDQIDPESDDEMEVDE